MGPNLPEEPQNWPWPANAGQTQAVVRSISLEKNSRGWTWKVSIEGTLSAAETVAEIEEMEVLMASRYGLPHKG